MRACWVFVLVAACGGGGVKDIKDTPPPAPPATCRTAGEHLTELIVSMSKTKPPDDAVNEQIEKTAKICEDNNWSEPARACFSKVKTVEEADACTKDLTPAQLDALAGKPDGKDANDEGGAPGGMQGGTPPPPPPTRGAVPKDGADPCDGGE